MPSITRTKQETVITVVAANRKISVIARKELTIEESRELRGLLKAEERKAESQSANGITFSIPFASSGSTFESYYSPRWVY